MLEIEHKHLVTSLDFLQEATRAHHIVQGYLSTDPTIRVRIRDDQGFITIKGASRDGGLSRSEYEYPIPLSDAQELLALCHGRTIHKTRHIVPHAGYEWEVDVFEGRHSGLIIAELEVETSEEQYPHPRWLGAEVTGERQYYNAYLALQGKNI